MKYTYARQNINDILGTTNCNNANEEWMSEHEKKKGCIFAESHVYIKWRGVVTGLTIIVM